MASPLKLLVNPKRYDPATGNLLRLPADLNAMMQEMMIEGIRRFPAVMNRLADDAENGNVKAAVAYGTFFKELVLRLLQNGQQRSLLEEGGIDDVLEKAKTDVLLQLREEVRAALEGRTSQLPDAALPTSAPTPTPLPESQA